MEILLFILFWAVAVSAFGFFISTVKPIRNTIGVILVAFLLFNLFTFFVYDDFLGLWKFIGIFSGGLFILAWILRGDLDSGKPNRRIHIIPVVLSSYLAYVWVPSLNIILSDIARFQTFWIFNKDETIFAVLSLSALWFILISRTHFSRIINVILENPEMSCLRFYISRFIIVFGISVIFVIFGLSFLLSVDGSGWFALFSMGAAILLTAQFIIVIFCSILRTVLQRYVSETFVYSGTITLLIILGVIWAFLTLNQSGLNENDFRSMLTMLIVLGSLWWGIVNGVTFYIVYRHSTTDTQRSWLRYIGVVSMLSSLFVISPVIFVWLFLFL